MHHFGMRKNIGEIKYKSEYAFQMLSVGPIGPIDINYWMRIFETHLEVRPDSYGYYISTYIY